MKLPAGFTMPGRTISDQDRKDYVLKLEKNLYGQKQAGRVWYLHLRKNLLKIGFKPSEHDECVYYFGKTIFIVYTDDTILLGPNKEEIDALVKKIGKVFKIEDQGKLSDYLGIKIERKDDTLEWTQPTLTHSILEDLKLVGKEIDKKQNKPNIKSVPANTSVPLTDHRDSPNHDPKDFDYRHFYWKTIVFGEINKTRYIMCSTPMCKTLCKSKDSTHSSSQKDRQISIGNKRQGFNYETKSRRYGVLGGCSTCF
jgi:hypothetical protein